MNSKAYILCQGAKVLGCYETLAAAEHARDMEIKKDWFSIFIKKKVAKAFAKTGNFPSDNYFIAEVISNEVPLPTF